MKVSMRAAGVALATALCLDAPSALGSRLGIGGESGNPNDCTDCHFGATGAVVQILASTFVPFGQTRSFRFLVSGGPDPPPQRICGFNVSTNGGMLVPSGADVRYADAPFSAELTHSTPHNYDYGLPVPVCEFDFEWTAPQVAGTYTIWGAGNSADNNFFADGDSIAKTMHSVVVPEPTGSEAGWFALVVLCGLRADRSRRRMRM